MSEERLLELADLVERLLGPAPDPVTHCNIMNTPDGLPRRIPKSLEAREFPEDELGELDIAVIMLRNHGYNHLADSVALARKALKK